MAQRLIGKPLACSCSTIWHLPTRPRDICTGAAGCICTTPIQTLSGVLLATTQGLEHRDYERITAALPQAAGAPYTDATAQAWASVLNGVLPEVKAGMQALMDADVPPPDEVGYEHANERGEVDAEAEAAWLAAQVVVLTAAQAEFALIWQALGWTTVLAAEGWEVMVQEKLNTAGAHP